MTSTSPNQRCVSRRELLLGAVAAAATARAWGQEVPAVAGDPTQKALAAAAEYLWSKQADDGGWHSPQYGLLKSGQALTPFVLSALLDVPHEIVPRIDGRVDRAMAFIISHIDDAGRLGCSDPEVIEYPVYSTAYALRCLSVAPNEPVGPWPQHGRYDEALQARAKKLGRDPEKPAASLQKEMVKFLVSAQYRQDNGFKETDAAYGGWGYNAPQQPGKSGHMDLAHTRCALQALSAAILSRTAEPDFGDYSISDRAEKFLLVVQKHPQAAARPQLPVDGPASIAPPPSYNGDAAASAASPIYDGGFYFSPVVLDANKGGIEEAPAPAHFRSYATATCDGLLALLACGVEHDPRNIRGRDERIARGMSWLKAHDDLTYPQGIPADVPEQWGAAMRFYHFAVRAEAYRRLEWPAEDRAKLAAVVRAEQEADGSFVNRTTPLMKEDDPLLCTTLATVALTNCL
jgi:hypothetical protein